MPLLHMNAAVALRHRQTWMAGSVTPLHSRLAPADCGYVVENSTELGEVLWVRQVGERAIHIQISRERA
jgi:hypothetical protein